jgi:hypothetical protein
LFDVLANISYRSLQYEGDDTVSEFLSFSRSEAPASSQKVNSCKFNTQKISRPLLRQKLIIILIEVQGHFSILESFSFSSEWKEEKQANYKQTSFSPLASEYRRKSLSKKDFFLFRYECK